MPLRLPPKPKASKGKSKQLHIDYSTLDAARASAPSDWDSDDWLTEGTRQEEQGERYQSGPKAARHYTNSTTCYRLAAALSPSAFDPRYNCARVFQTLATDHSAAPACLEALDNAIQGYREGLAVLPDGEGGTARIDGLFNLAQADVALYEMFDEGVAAVEREAERALQAAQEAKQLFVEVERLQRVEMEKVFGASGPDADEAGDESEAMDEAGSSAGGSATEVQAVETTIVTPQLIVDTLIEAVALDVSLYSSVSSPEDQAALRDSATAALARADALRAIIPRSPSSPSQPDDLDLELALARASALSTFSPTSPDATAYLQSFLSSLASPRVELLSLLADSLVDSLPLSSPLSSLLPTLETALQTYQQASALLSSRLSPPKNVPSAHIPVLLSANLVAQSSVHLLAYTLSSHSPSETSRPHLTEHLKAAHQLALDALAAPKSGLSLAVPASSRAGAAKPTLALVRAPASTEPRTDWRTLSAVRAALFTLVRVRLRLDPSAEGWEGEKKQFWALWRAVGLGAARAGADEAALRRREVGWWAEESGEDRVSEAMSAEEREGERAWWSSLAE
ncbi:hypothetical protein JCM8097_000485 [Rhodosporidiobolus ruineniae]